MQIISSISENSYNMYLVHYIFPMTLPLYFCGWTKGPVLVKFGLVSIVTIIFSYLISRFDVKPYPKLTIIGFIVINGILIILI